jgi:predicted SAM-dependent methyltransferase
MKLCLMLDSKDYVRPGYINIDPFAPTEDKLRIRDDLQRLNIADDGEVEEILAMDVLNYFSLQESNALIQSWVRKLKRNGIITIGFYDVYCVCKLIGGRVFDVATANQILHGRQDKPWHTRRNSISLEDMTKLLEGYGLEILQKRIDFATACIKAKRP